MDLEQYIWYLHENYENINARIGKAEEILLYSFIEKHISSAYDCSKYLKEYYKKVENRSIAYKNVHTKIQKLYKLNLIQKEENNKENNESIHGAIYYRITRLGIFYLLKNKLARMNKKIITDYEKNEIYRFFLYPHITLNTITKISFDEIDTEIFNFLSKCCLEINSLLFSLDGIKKNGGVEVGITTTDSIIDPKLKYEYYVGSREFTNYLKEKFKIKWLDINKTNIIEVDKDKIIKIFNDDQNFLLLEIFEEKNKAILSDGGGRLIFEFNIDILGKSSFLLCEFRPERVEDIIRETPKNEYFMERMFSYVSELVNRILRYNLDIQDEIHLKGEKDKIASLKALASDQIFLLRLTEIKQQFDLKYNKFINLVNDT